MTLEINEQRLIKKIKKAFSLYGNWIYMMTTAVVVVVVVMHASKNKILTLNDFAEDLIKFVHFFLNWKT
jgi:hypothetical protein